MKSRTGISIDSIGALGQISVGIVGSKLDLDRRYRDEVSSVISCQLRFCPVCCSDAEAASRCKRCVAFVALSARNSIQGLTPSLLKRVHQAVAPEVESHGRFRIGNVVVGGKTPSTAFVTSKIDVEKHLKECFPMFHRLSIEGRSALIIYVMSILHPFEDGNGRVMRALLTMLAAHGEPGSAHLLFLALYVKLRQREMVSAVQWLCDGSVREFTEFMAQAKRHFQSLELEFLSESGRVVRWVSSQLEVCGESQTLLNL